VIAIFTKFDDLVKQVYDDNLEMAENRRVALEALDAKFQAPLSKFKFPPKSYLRLEKMQRDNGNHQDQVKELTEKTADSLDNLALKMLYVSVQQNNLELCLRYAVENAPKSFDSMTDMIDYCLQWFRHAYYGNYDYGKTEIIEKRRRWFDFLLELEEERGEEERGVVRFAVNSADISKFVNTKFDKPSLAMFSAILICMESSFWYQSQFMASFRKAFKVYVKSGTRDKLETSLEALESYPPPGSDISSFNSSLLEILLKHRLTHDEHSKCIIC